MASLPAGWAWAMERGRTCAGREAPALATTHLQALSQAHSADQGRGHGGPQGDQGPRLPPPRQAPAVPSAATDRHSLSGIVTKLLRLN